MKLDFGCGKNKRAGFIGIDVMQFDGVDQVVDLRQPWPWETDSVEEAHASHFIEHLNGSERIHFWNELYRVLKKDAKAQIIVPHWASGRAYGDLTHQWPPVVEFSFYYLDKAWRDVNAPHCGLTCDFHAQWGYSIGAPWNSRSDEAQAFAVNHYREVAQDLVATVTKR